MFRVAAVARRWVRQTSVLADHALASVATAVIFAAAAALGYFASQQFILTIEHVLWNFDGGAVGVYPDIKQLKRS